ncbi:MAG: AAA domain-containing protein [Candidatus Dormibacteria bacterium]
MVVELAASGHTVGITANSHAVISHLLEAVLTESRLQGLELRASQKADPGQGATDPGVTRRGDVAGLLVDLHDGVKVVGGTAWVFSRPELDQRLDYLVVDEAGQLSLANVCAVATSARNLVLVGDPRQLSQPSQGTHPEGAGVSALEHFLEDADTMPPTLGVFLDHTHRSHPAICQYISEIYYQGRLQSLPGCERQTVLGSGWLSGSGLRWAPTEHQGNAASSTEEAVAVAEIVGDLLRRTWVDRRGAERPIGLNDILMVAPFNAQVARLAARLPAGARMGTVDRFQGQEAAVVIVSLTTSSADDTPHGLDFLFSRERLNVAVSRAAALSVIVGSPALLRTRCHTVGQLRLVNGLCRYVELAETGGDTQLLRSVPPRAKVLASGEEVDMFEADNIRDWLAHDVVDETGDKVGELEAIYYDTASDEPSFATVKVGVLSHRLVFVPLQGAKVGPGFLKVAYGKKLVQGAPAIETDGGLQASDEPPVFEHYGLAYQPGASGERRLARR